MRPPPGRQRLSREFIARHQRARIVTALAEETMDRGYRAVTVADIVRRAGIARNTFYDNFSSKEDCFLADPGLRGRGVAARGWSRPPPRPRAGRSASPPGSAPSSSTSPSEPALARTCIVEALSAGDAAQERYEQSLQAFVPLLRIGREYSPHGEDLPETLEETIAGGIFWVIYQRIVLGETEQIESLLPDLVDFALTPYIGAESAQRATARL